MSGWFLENVTLKVELGGKASSTERHQRDLSVTVT